MHFLKDPALFPTVSPQGKGPGAPMFWVFFFFFNYAFVCITGSAVQKGSVMAMSWCCLPASWSSQCTHEGSVPGRAKDDAAF